MEIYIPLCLVKEHLHIDEWFNDDDQYLENLILVSQEVVSNHIGYSLEEILDPYGCIPKPIEQAILLLIGHFYNNRETTSTLTVKEVPLAYEYLLQQYKNYRYND